MTAQFLLIQTRELLSDSERWGKGFAWKRRLLKPDMFCPHGGICYLGGELKRPNWLAAKVPAIFNSSSRAVKEARTALNDAARTMGYPDAISLNDSVLSSHELVMELFDRAIDSFNYYETPTFAMPEIEAAPQPEKELASV